MANTAPLKPPGKVLVVDDDPDTLQILGITLQRAGYEVFRASNGGQALEQMELNDPETIVLDVMMPDMSGLEVLRSLKIKYPWPPPVVMLTAKGQITDKVAGMEAGAFKYLIKPISRDQLLETVREAVEAKRNRPRLTGRQ